MFHAAPMIPSPGSFEETCAMKQRVLPILILVVLASALSGCIKFKQRITINEDLSGELKIHYGLDLDGMVWMTTMMGSAFGGPAADMSSEKLKGVKEELVKELGTEPKDMMIELGDAAAKVPAGTSLKSFKAWAADNMMNTELIIGFEHVNKVAEMKNAPLIRDTKEMASMIESALKGWIIEDTESTLTLRGIPYEKDPKNPFANPPDDKSDPTAVKMKELVEGIEYTVELVAPFQVKEHNAAKVEGDTLTWHYTWADLGGVEAMPEMKVVFDKAKKLGKAAKRAAKTEAKPADSEGVAGTEGAKGCGCRQGAMNSKLPAILILLPLFLLSLKTRRR